MTWRLIFIYTAFGLSLREVQTLDFFGKSVVSDSVLLGQTCGGVFSWDGHRRKDVLLIKRERPCDRGIYIWPRPHKHGELQPWLALLCLSVLHWWHACTGSTYTAFLSSTGGDVLGRNAAETVWWWSGGFLLLPWIWANWQSDVSWYRPCGVWGELWEDTWCL